MEINFLTHIFMTPEQIRDEIKGVAKLIDEVYSLFGFKYHVESVSYTHLFFYIGRIWSYRSGNPSI